MDKVEQLREEQDRLFASLPKDIQKVASRLMAIEYLLAMVEEGHDVHELDDE
jgi:hypothetical protein